MSPDEPDVVLTETYTPESDESISLLIVRLVAAASGRPEIELEPIAHHIDTDALDTLFSPANSTESRRTVGVSFSYEGYRVEIDADRTVRLREGPDSPE